MLLLPNGAKCSELSVFPKNWETCSNAALTKIWYIKYRYYAPEGKVKPVVIKGFHTFKTLSERRNNVQKLLENELDLLQNRGYNPILKQCFGPEKTDFIVEPSTPFIAAFGQALKRLSLVDSTKKDIASKISIMKKAAGLLFMSLPICELKRRHILLLLGKVRDICPKFSDNTFNSYRAYLRMLFVELVEIEAVEANPINDIRKKKHVAQKKRLLTPEECQQIDEFVAAYDYNFWRLIHIFFHSGSRTTEIFRVQGEHVDLQKQSVKYLVLKGENYDWVERPIKDLALPLWRELMQDCRPKDYVFSVGLVPGEKPIRPDQAKKRWARHIQGKRIGRRAKGTVEKLSITCTWYGLKHLNTTQTIEWLNERTSVEEGQKLAAQQNGHKSTAMVVKIYDVNAETRKHEKLKAVNNRFAGG